MEMEVQVNDKPLTMEVDSGTVLSVISHKEVQDLLPTVIFTNIHGQHVTVLEEHQEVPDLVC